MRRWALAALALAGCATTRPELLRKLHDEQLEVQSAESAELPYRARTPELGPLLGASRADVFDQLGPGRCDPDGPGERCRWRLSNQGAPLDLELQLADDKVTAARWRAGE